MVLASFPGPISCFLILHTEKRDNNTTHLHSPLFKLGRTKLLVLLEAIQSQFSGTMIIQTFQFGVK